MPEFDLHGATVIVAAGVDSIPHGMDLATRTDIAFAYIRGVEAKGHGMKQRIEGGSVAGANAYVVYGQDMTLDQATEILNDAGISVVGSRRDSFKESNYEPATWYV